MEIKASPHSVGSRATADFGQEMSYGRSLERWLKLFDLPLRYTEWATLAQDRAEWARLITRKRPH